MDKNLNEILDELSSKEFLNILTKITSINNEPVNNIPINEDGNPAITINIAFLNTCP